MQLNEFSIAQPRPMPVFILADTSGSMDGEKIQSVNVALRDMVATLRTVQDIRGEIQIAIITFGGDVNILQELAPLNDVVLTELTASGNTPMGEAIELVLQMLEDKNTVPSRSFSPTVVLISDGLPTDVPAELYVKAEEDRATEADFLNWSPLAVLHSSERGQKSIRLAMGIGDDANDKMLTAFVNSPSIPVIRARDVRGIEKFFQWVTLSVSLRSTSHNPDIPSVPVPEEFDDDEIVV